MNVEGWKALANQHVQIVLTPQEYQQITGPYYPGRRGRILSVSLAGDDYWNCMPRYLTARCPICDAVWSALLDTYNLRGWSAEIRGKYIFMPDRQEIGCRHAVAVQNSIHLHGLVPFEMMRFSNRNSEVPFVMPILLPDDVESYAVMHALPICRVEREQFAPRYTVFIVTYYSTHPQELIERRQREIPQDVDWPPEDFMYTAGRAHNIPESWDLPSWVKKGKLLWLDLTQDDLPLKAGPVEGFPYTNIEGIRHRHFYRAGRPIIQP